MREPRPFGVPAAQLAFAMTVGLGSIADPHQVPVPTMGQTAPVLISGTVVDALTGEPFAGATVECVGPIAPLGGPAGTELPPVVSQRVVADALGRFVLWVVGTGDYQVGALAPGYAPGLHGQTRPDGSMIPVRVAAGSRTTDLTLRMWRLASIRGVVEDNSGNPQPGAAVMVWRQTWRAGVARFVRVDPWVETDDRGTYAVDDLLPGRYLVVAPASTVTVQRPSSSEAGLRVNGLLVRNGPMSGQSWVVLPVGPDATEVRQLTCAPAAEGSQSAQLLTIAPGDDRNGVTVQQRRSPAVRVSGRVRSAGGAVPALQVRLRSRLLDDLAGPVRLDTASTVTDQAGGFVLLGVPPGDYWVIAEPVTGLAQPARNPNAPAPLWGETSIAVAGDDVAGIDLVVTEGPAVSGRVVLEGPSSRPSADAMRRLLVALDAPGSRFGTESFQTRPSDDGRFSVQVPPGRYVVSVRGVPRPWGFQGARIGEAPVVYDAMTLSGDGIADAVLTLTDRPPELWGLVTDRGGRPAPHAAVMLIPPPAQWSLFVHPGRFVSTSTDRDGNFRVPSLPPGDYSAIAIEQSLGADWQEPAILQRLRAVGVSVTVREGGSSTVRLTLADFR